jgi:hypothetical protein
MLSLNGLLSPVPSSLVEKRFRLSVVVNRLQSLISTVDCWFNTCNTMFVIQNFCSQKTVENV